MKKIICTILAVVTLFSLVACGKAHTPVDSMPLTQTDEKYTEDSVVAEDTATGHENSLEETKAAQEDVPVSVTPVVLPAPIAVEDQLSSGDTQTIVMDSLEDYEKLLHDIGFVEVALNNTCEPVSLTYNEKAFRLDFVYCYNHAETNEKVKEDRWYMYGTKSNSIANISMLNEAEYMNPSGIDLTNYEYEGKAEDFCYHRRLFFGKFDKALKLVCLEAIYYPETGTLFNYLRDPECEGRAQTNQAMDQNGNSASGQAVVSYIVGEAYYLNLHKTVDENEVG